MSLSKRLSRFVLAGALAGFAGEANAQAPVAPTPTLWNWLGIPQGANKVRDGLVNRRGNHPGLERKPPLKRIGDPSLKEVDNAAIKKAQEIKAEEDLAPQKIKAIKYLASMGCGKCYKGVDDALLEALKDCTESVRYATVTAIGETRDQKCAMCDGNCCSEKITEQLAKMAYERDEKHPDCWYEPSERVREAAKEALKICCPGRQPPPGVETQDGTIEPKPVEPKPIEPKAGESGKTTMYPRSPAGDRSAKASARTPINIFGVSKKRPSNRAPAPIQLAPNYSSPIQASDATVKSEPAEAATATDIGTERESNDPAFKEAIGRFIRPDGTPTAAPPSVVASDAGNGTAGSSAAVRQPDSLTRRAQQPAVRLAAPELISPSASASPRRMAGSEPARVASNAISQPRSLAPVRPISVESSRRAYAASDAAAQPRMAAQPKAESATRVTDSSAEISSPRGLQQPARLVPVRDAIELPGSEGSSARVPRTGFAPPRIVSPASSIEDRNGGSPASDAAGSDPAVGDGTEAVRGARGAVARISFNAGTVEIKFPGGSRPAIGTRVSVYHDYLTGRSQVGQLEVVAVGNGTTTARPVGNVKLSKIGAGDQVIVEAR